MGANEAAKRDDRIRTHAIAKVGNMKRPPSLSTGLRDRETINAQLSSGAHLRDDGATGPKPIQDIVI